VLINDKGPWGIAFRQGARLDRTRGAARRQRNMSACREARAVADRLFGPDARDMIAARPRRSHRRITSMRAILPLLLAALATPALALDINSFRAQHRLPPLSYSAALSGAAQAHASDLARRDHLDHAGFRERMGALSSTAAENVAYIKCPRGSVQASGLFGGLLGGPSGGPAGCSTADKAFSMWARSAGHRRNMLMKGISSYGLADAVSSSGKHYWVLELGN
jgi:uncharacterized protein YkwD